MKDGQELRKGNYLNHRYLGITQVSSISETGINFSLGYEGYLEIDFEGLSPVPITKDWLINDCKFEDWEQDASYLHDLDYVCLYIADDHCTLFEVCSDNENMGRYWLHQLKTFKYRHELQNFYYFYTGHEIDYLNE